MSKQIQPRFQLLLNGVDVTDDVKDEVTFVDEPNNISNLSFMLSGSEYIMSSADVVKLGDRVEFYGGTMGESFIEPTKENYKLFFYGHVKNIAPDYADTGLLSVSIEAIDTGYVAMKEKRKFSYPTANAKVRSWANVDKITVNDIIEGIVVKELKMNLGTVMLPDDNIFYTLKSPIKQAGINDWKFLIKLAKLNGCNVYTRTEENKTTYIDFIDIGKTKNALQEKVRFVYPLRENNYLKDTPNANSYKYPTINDAGTVDIVALTISVSQDLSLFYANRRVYQLISPETGKSVSLIQTFDELSQEMKDFNKESKAKGEEEPYKVAFTSGGKQFINAYYKMEVDPSKLPPDPEEARKVEDIAKKVMSQEKLEDGTVASFEDIKPYFKRAEFMDARYRVADEPYVGIDVNMTIEGDVFLKNSVSYRILGIQRYGSDNLESSYALITTTHRWGDDGYFCDLQFKL